MILDSISSIAALVASSIALASVILTFRLTKKSWFINIVTPQRLVWAENLRNAVSGLADAFYEGKDLRGPRARIYLYLTPQNPKHAPLITEIEGICNGTNTDFDSVVFQTQILLRKNWWTVKAESEISYSEEVEKEKKVQEQGKVKTHIEEDL